MFKGISKRAFERFEKINHDNSSFVFSFADLELVEINGKRRKCRLISDELSQKLHQIYSEGKSGYIPPIKFIDFELPENSSDSLFFHILTWTYCFNYGYFLKLNKKYVQENSKVFSDGTLCFNFITNTLSLDDIPGENNDFCKAEYRKSHSTRSSAIQQIKNTIQKGNIDLKTLAQSTLLGESYVGARPADCLHCSDPEELVPGREAKYYETHINKCIWRPDRINEFKDSQLALIERIITNFNNYKNNIIQQIINYAQEQGLTEAELNNTRSGWQDHLRKLTNREQIEDYQAELEEDIENLAEAKKKPQQERQQAEEQAKQKAQQQEAERLKKEQAEKEKKEAAEKKKQAEETKKQTEEQELAQKRGQFIMEITTTLRQEPPLTNNELSPQYQNWEEQINQLTNPQQFTNLQDRLLADIQARRQDKKTAQEVKENLQKAQSGTPEEQQQAFDNLEKQETEKGYQDNQDQINNLKKDQATKNPQEYGEKSQKRITEKLKDNRVKEDELDKENQQAFQNLKNGQIKDPDQLVATETKIKQNIYQVEAQKKITNFTSRVNQVLKSKLKSQLATLKKELLSFISSSNIYYSAQKKAAENLLSKLESFENSGSQQNNSSVAKPNNLVWKIVSPLLLIGTCLLILRVKKVAKRKKNSKLRKQVKL